jgi:large subunit ribosomal protein L22
MADEKDIKDEAKADEAKAAEKAESKPAAKKESKPKAEKKDSADKKDSKDSGAKAAKKESKKAPKADKADKAPKADKAEKADKGKDDKEEKKPRRRRAKKADKAEDKKPAPSRRRRRDTEEVPVVRASAKYVRVAPRKARLIADQVRGMHIEQARALLAFSPRGAAEDIHKLINSAAANAENNHDLVGDEMRISSITVDEGPTLRRFRPRALGRATPINKRTSHIAVALTPVEDD